MVRGKKLPQFGGQYLKFSGNSPKKARPPKWMASKVMLKSSGILRISSFFRYRATTSIYRFSSASRCVSQELATLSCPLPRCFHRLGAKAGPAAHKFQVLHTVFDFCRLADEFSQARKNVWASLSSSSAIVSPDMSRYE